MAESVSGALSGIQAPSQGSTVNDAQGALAAFLGGVISRRDQNRKDALEQAKLEVSQRQAGAQEMMAEAQMGQVRATERRTDLAERQHRTYVEDVLPMEIEATKASVRHQNAESATLEASERDIMLSQRGYRMMLRDNFGVADEVLDGLNPRATKDLFDKHMAIAHARAQNSGGMAGAASETVRRMAETLEGARARLNDLENQKIQFLGTIGDDILVTHPRTGQPVSYGSVVEEFGDREIANNMLMQADPQFMALEQAIQAEQQFVRDAEQGAMQAFEIMNRTLQAGLETAAGQAERAVAQDLPPEGRAALGQDPVLVDPETNLQMVPQPPPEAVDSLAGLAATSPSTVASMLPTLEARYPGIQEDMIARGIDVETLSQRMAMRTQEAFQAAGRLHESYQVNQTLTNVAPEMHIKSLKTILDGRMVRSFGDSTSLATSHGMGVNTVAVAKQALELASTLGAQGITAGDVEANLSERQRNSHVWELVKARWPTRMGNLQIRQ